MRDLQPLSAYQNTSKLSFGLAALALGVLWGVPMTLFMLRTHQGSLGFVLKVAAVGALMFGTLITLLARLARRQLTQQVYHCAWPIVPAAPPGQYEARLMCTLLYGAWPVGGHLYIGRENWAFVPHTRNGPFYRKPVRWERPGQLSLSIHRPRLRKGDQVVLADGESRAVLVVPNAAEVVAALEEYRRA